MYRSILCSQMLIERGVLEVLAGFCEAGTMADLRLNAIWALKVRYTVNACQFSPSLTILLFSEHGLSLFVGRQMPAHRCPDSTEAPRVRLISCPFTRS